MDPGLVLLILGVSAFAHGALADIYLMVIYWVQAREHCLLTGCAARRILTQNSCLVHSQTSTYTFDPIPDVPADFGPDIGDGVVGYLRVSPQRFVQASLEGVYAQAGHSYVVPTSLSRCCATTECLLIALLQVADPLDSCSAYTFTDFETPWVALIARNQPYHPTNCTFDVKVCL